MNAVSLRRMGIVALSLALLSLLVIALLSQRNWSEFEEANHRATLTAQILTLNQRVLGLMRDAETGERGFLLTGLESYLKPYDAAVAEVPKTLGELRSLTAARPRQRERVERLAYAADSKLQEMRNTIKVRRETGLDAALRAAETGKGQEAMDEVRQLSQSIENYEYQLWRDSSTAVQAHANQARRLTITGVVLLAFLLVSAFVANQSSAGQRERLIVELAEASRSATQVRDLLRTTFYSIADAVITLDSEGRVRLMNSVAERLTGTSEQDARGRQIESVFRVADGADRPPNPARAVLAGGMPRAAATLRLDGGPRSGTPVDVSAAPIRNSRGVVQGCVLVFRDISDRLRQEEKLLETAKLESLGVLAGGIAHDFNNLLVGIVGNASLLREELRDNAFAIELLEGVERAGDRAAQLTRQMLAYSGRGHFVVRPLDLSSEVEQLLTLLRASIPKTVSLRLSLEAGLPPVQADAAQLQQLFMNLVINAAEALEGRPGVVEIATSVERVAADTGPLTVLHDPLAPGEYVMLRVTDNGIGMDEATRARIFDPFFTTKFTGRGLGLAAVLGIVKGHGGGILVESELGKGTTFRVYLPVARAAAGYARGASVGALSAPGIKPAPSPPVRPPR